MFLNWDKKYLSSAAAKKAVRLEKQGGRLFV